MKGGKEKLQREVFELPPWLGLGHPNSPSAAHPVPAAPTQEQKECVRGFQEFAITKAPPLQGSPRPWMKANKFLHLY